MSATANTPGCPPEGFIAPVMPIVDAIRAAATSPLYNMPVIEQVRWTLIGPLTDDERRALVDSL